MEIVIAELEDLAELSQLFDEYRVFYQQESDLAGGEAFLRQRMENQESYIWLAILDEQVVGFTQLYPCFSSVSLASQWLLNDLYVSPKARRQGVAQGLIEEVLAFSQGMASKGVLLETAATNLPAQSLYEKIGFVREKNYQFFYSTESDD
ncbi:GNAT family N-acetyltransferase [Vagococcus sp. BWB3-3]|uniref:GNAT family N-acetyltransferase n=1 Tax=Vagococcus allomyrinae TaxID=2794353 RepID=A0A940STB2_9ENTE|nr:GNAT family N-acetyltransferase [Vagococcus allomyrinae]MBP1042942.1 GNAT family N-acetyltransferase [Vagococcus allomyrinae]